MNPLTGITSIVGSISALLSMGTSMGMQANNLHRQFNPPQQQAQIQQMQCPPPRYKLEVIVTASGQRELACVEQVQ